MCHDLRLENIAIQANGNLKLISMSYIIPYISIAYIFFIIIEPINNQNKCIHKIHSYKSYDIHQEIDLKIVFHQK